MFFTNFYRLNAMGVYFIVGGDRDDVIQEGMIGLFKAVRDFDPKRYASFRTFAEVCIKNRLLSVIKAAARDKHMPLNSSVSFDPPLFSGNSDRYPYGAPQPQEKDPEEIFQLKRRILELTPMLTEMNELAELTAHYYDRGYWRNEKYIV